MMTATPFFTPVEPTTSASDLPSLQGTTLILPAVSIGSVPQLAVDLLLHSAELHLVKVGRLDPSFCFPFVGPSDSPVNENTDITTALEVYSNGSVSVVQQRSPVYRSRSAAFISSLISWIESTLFTETLWLSSIDAAARTDAEFSTPILSLFPPTCTPSTPLLSTLSSSFPAFSPLPDPHGPPATDTVPYIPGSLLTRKLLLHLASLSRTHSLPLGALLYFAAEGDTRADAHAMANLVLHTLLPPAIKPSPRPAPKEQPLVEPNSWAALFGRPPTDALYA